MHRLLSCTALLATAVLAHDAPSKRTLWTDLEARNYTYTDWLVEHGEQFPGSEEVFNANMEKIRKHNSDSAQTFKVIKPAVLH